MSKRNSFRNLTRTLSEPTVLITHRDLDGLGCAVLLSKVYPKMITYLCEAGETNEVIPSIVKGLSTKTRIIITDLSVNQDVAEKLNNRGNVELIDHHKSAEWLEKYSWAIVRTKHSATKLVYLIYSRMITLSDYQQFVDLVDDWDMWGYDAGPKPESKALNTLLWVLTENIFLQRFVTNPVPVVSKEEQFAIMLDDEKKKKYIADSIPNVAMLIDPKGNQYGLITADQYRSELGNEILKAYAEIEYIMMIDFRGDAAHLRGRGNVDLSALAVQAGGGGHAKAAGFPLRGAALRMIWDCEGKCKVTAALIQELAKYKEGQYGSESESPSRPEEN